MTSVLKIVLAIDSFKSCLTSVEAEQAAAMGISHAGIDAEIVSIPVSDGGEGMLDAFACSSDAQLISVNAHDAMMRPIVAQYGIVGDVAVIESAKAIGLTLIPEPLRDPMRATSYGCGELFADAIKRGYKKYIIGLGGSATSDAGIGMLQALVDHFGEVGEHIQDVIQNQLQHLDVRLASDVTNPLLGINGAASVFASQKGASSAQTVMLERRARTFADMSARLMGYDRREVAGAGAAGGLGYAYIQYFQATTYSGAELLFNLNQFDKIIRDCDLIITGEGSADQQTMMGKLPFKIFQHAFSYNKPVFLIAGKIANRESLFAVGFNKVECINPIGLIDKEAVEPTIAKKNIQDTVKRMLTENYFIQNKHNF